MFESFPDRLELQWGLGENPGRNRVRNRAPCERMHGFNGAWAKTQEGTDPPDAKGKGRFCFNGAWAKTQEGTRSPSTSLSLSIEASMGPGRKPRKEPYGEAVVARAPVLQWGLGENPGRNLVDRHAARSDGLRASMGPGRKPRKERC